MGLGEVAILNRLVRVGFIEMLTFEQKLGSPQVNDRDTRGESGSGRGTTKADT